MLSSAFYFRRNASTARRMISAAAIAGVLAIGLGATLANGATQVDECAEFLARGYEGRYLRASTSAERAAATDDFLAFLSRLPDVSKSEGFTVSDHSLSTAWWDIAFYRRGAPVRFPQRLTDENMAALLIHPDRRIQAETLRTAYGIANARMRLTEQFTRVNAWFDARLPKFKGWGTEKTVVKLPNWDLGQRLTAKVKVSNAERTNSLTKYAVLKLKDLVVGVGMFAGNVLSPVPLRVILPGRWFRATDPIFRALEKNPARELLPKEVDLLRKYGALEVYEKRRLALLANPKWYKGVHIVDGVAKWAIAGAAAVAIGAAFVQSAWGDGTLSVEELLNDPQFALESGQIQLINETVPFPHLAIRIGDEVFSYGVEQMTMTRAKDYLTQNLKGGEVKGALPRLMAYVRGRRSVQVTTLNLDEASVLRLRRYLALQTQKRYQNVTFMNDCSTMIARALRSEAGVKIPNLIDPSPSSMTLYFAQERIFGNPQVASVRLVTAGPNQDPWLHLLRNAYVNLQESKLYYDPRSLIPVTAGRIALDARKTDADLQYHTREQLEAYSRYRDDAEKMILEDPDIGLYLENSAAIMKDPESKLAVSEYFDKVYKRELAQMEGRSADFYDLISGYYRIQFLSDVEREILGKSSMNISETFRDPVFLKELNQVVANIDAAYPQEKTK